MGFDMDPEEMMEEMMYQQEMGMGGMMPGMEGSYG